MQEEKPLKEVLEEMLKHYRLKGKFQQARIRKIWGQTVGPVIDKYTRELKVHRRRLIVVVDSAPLRQELSMNREKIRNLMNEALKEEYLREVLIR